MVEVPDERMPELASFALSALTEAMHLARVWSDETMGAGEIEHVTSVDGRAGLVWVWDNSGSGDFTRISSTRYGTRWMVHFDHESSRSPWGREPEELAPGVGDWIADYDLQMLRESDRLLMHDGPLSATEIFWLRPSAHDRDALRWRTSPSTAALNMNLAGSDASRLFSEDADLAELYTRMLDGHRPRFAELEQLLGAELPAAAAVLTLHRIDLWLADDRL